MQFVFINRIKEYSKTIIQALFPQIIQASIPQIVQALIPQIHLIKRMQKLKIQQIFQMNILKIDIK